MSFAADWIRRARRRHREREAVTAAADTLTPMNTLRITRLVPPRHGKTDVRTALHVARLLGLGAHRGR